MADRFEDLRTFTTVISCGGINAAAAELGIAKSAVSRRISDLEKRLGATLIERSTRRFEPTAVGAEYAARAATILASLDDLDASLASGGGGTTVSIAAPAAMTTHLILPALGTAAQALDGIVVRFVDEGDPSADIVVGMAAGAGLEGLELTSTGKVVCASPAYLRQRGTPTDPQRLEGHSAIAVAGPSPANWRLGAGTRRMPPSSISVSEEDAAAAAAVAGLGLVQLPDYVVARALADGLLTRVLEAHDPPPARIHASYRDDAGLATRRIVDALADALG